MLGRVSTRPGASVDAAPRRRARTCAVGRRRGPRPRRGEPAHPHGEPAAARRGDPRGPRSDQRLDGRPHDPAGAVHGAAGAGRRPGGAPGGLGPGRRLGRGARPHGAGAPGPRRRAGVVAVRGDGRRRDGHRPRRHAPAGDRQDGLPGPPVGAGDRPHHARDDGGGRHRRGGGGPARDRAGRVVGLAPRVGAARGARRPHVGPGDACRATAHVDGGRAGRRLARPAVAQRHGVAARGLPVLPVLAVLLGARVDGTDLRVTRVDRPGRRPPHGGVHRCPARLRARRPPRCSTTCATPACCSSAPPCWAGSARPASGSPRTSPRGRGPCSSEPGRAPASRWGSACSCGSPPRRGTAPGSRRWPSSSATRWPRSGRRRWAPSRTRPGASRCCGRSSPSSPCRSWPCRRGCDPG